MKGLTVWLYSLTYNESHFVKNFLEAYKWVDKIIISDNMSTDNTVELLKQDPRVEVRYYDTGNTIKDGYYLDYKNNAWKEARGQADWVVVVDFDEIFTRAVLVDGKPLFDLDLTVPHEKGFNIIRPFGYNMVSLNAPLGAEGHPFEHSKIGAYHVPQEKMCCFKPSEISEIRFHAGCHHADPLDMEGSTKSIKVFFARNYKMLHYKFWNLDLYMKRMAEYQTRLSDENKEFGWGWHYMESLQYHHDTFVRGHDLCQYLFDIKSPYD